jgi:pilus assembly protein TadC
MSAQINLHNRRPPETYGTQPLVVIFAILSLLEVCAAVISAFEAKWYECAFFCAAALGSLLFAFVVDAILETRWHVRRNAATLARIEDRLRQS